MGGEERRSARSAGWAADLGRPDVAVRRQKVVMFLASEKGADLDPITELIESGQVTPVIDTAYPLEKAADAMAHLESGRARGKIAISVRQ